MGPGVSCQLDRRYILRQILVRGRQIPRPPTRGRAFDTFCLTQELELRARDSKPPVIAGFVDDDRMDHAVGAQVWERVNQQAIDHAEDGCRGADAQGQRNNCSKSEAGPLAQLAPGEPQIVQHVLYTAERPKVYVVSASR